MNNKTSIINFCRSLGLTTVGFTTCRVFSELENYYSYRKEKGFQIEFEEDDIEKRINPFLLMEDGKTIISIAFPYLHDENRKAKYFSKYTLGEDYHVVVKRYLQRICGYIESLSGKAIGFVDNNPLPERYIAYLCGIGFVGKNNTFITREYGSYVFLGEIITDLPLEIDSPIKEGCSKCQLCLNACPTSTLKEEAKDNDFNECLSYMTQKKHIDEYWFDKFKGKIFGCDICQDICPYNKKAKFSYIEEFKAFDFMKEDELIDIINMNNTTFKEKYQKCSCGWRGKNILIRNSLINYNNIKHEDKDNIIKNINSPYIREYYDKLFKNKT